MKLDRAQQMMIAFVLFPVMLVWLVNGVYMSVLARMSTVLFWLADLVQWIVLPAFLLVMLARRAKIFPWHYGLGLAGLRWQTLIPGSLLVFATAGLTFRWVRNYSWQWLDKPAGIFNFDLVIPAGLPGQISVLYSAVTAGLVESIFFISLPWLLYRSLRDGASPATFTLLISIVFAFAHWEQGPHLVISAYLTSLVLCFWYFRLGSLWPVVAGHMLIDLFALS